jgi:hypothetical protein
LKKGQNVELVYKQLGIDLYITHVFEFKMNSTAETGAGRPNKTTKVNTKNGEYTIVASVRMHSDGGNRGVEEDVMYCLAVNDRTGEMVSWDTYWVEDYNNSQKFGWGGGSYQPHREGQHEDQNNAINRFSDRVKYETTKCISRALGRQEKVLKEE